MGFASSVLGRHTCSSGKRTVRVRSLSPSPASCVHSKCSADGYAPEFALVIPPLAKKTLMLDQLW